MAAGQHNPSRRALLGAVGALPLLGVGDLVAAPEDEADRGPPASAAAEALAWARALDAYETAEEAMLEAEASPAGDEAEDDARRDALCAALGRLLRTPAPDLQALRLKIDIALEQGAGTPPGWAACLVAIRADALRLGAG
jgi:hypothetical protein